MSASPVKPMRHATQPPARMVHAAFQSRAGSKRVQALLGTSQNQALKTKQAPSRLSQLLADPKSERRDQHQLTRSTGKEVPGDLSSTHGSQRANERAPAAKSGLTSASQENLADVIKRPPKPLSGEI